MASVVALVLSAVLVGIDQLIKLWAQDVLSKAGTIPLIEGVLHLTYAENRGAAFNILQNQRWLLVGVTFVVLLFLVLLIIKKSFPDIMATLALSLIVGGGFGNLIDRFFRHYVIDYVDFRLINFAIFNFADTCVVCGTILLLIYLLFIHKQEPKEQSKPFEMSGEASDHHE